MNCKLTSSQYCAMARRAGEFQDMWPVGCAEWFKWHKIALRCIGAATNPIIFFRSDNELQTA